MSRVRDGAPRTAWPRRRLVVLGGVGLVAVALALVASASHALRPIEQTTIDTRFSIEGASAAPNNIVLVDIDAATVGALDGFPFHRRYHASVIDRLVAGGARAIGYDVEFVTQTDATDDNDLITAIAHAHGIVLASIYVNTNGTTPVLGGAAKSLGAHVGYTGLKFDSDGVERRYVYSQNGLLAFPVALAEQVTGRPVPASEFPGGSAPVDFVGPPGTFKSISFLSVLHGQYPANFFRGKTVIVGASDPDLQDLHSTAEGGLMTGAEFWANALETALHGNPLQDASGGLNVLLIVLLGLAVPLAGVRLRPAVMLALGCGFAVVFAVAVQLAFSGGTIVTFTYPFLALVLGTLGSAGVVSVEERRGRERAELALGRLPSATADFFISYRRDQSSWPAGVLKNELAERFGSERVFMDSESLHAGEQWPRRIEEAVKSCSVLLALIGPDWAGASDREGKRRLDNPRDFVRLEIETALQAEGVAVVPVLLDGAKMPRVDELPESLQPLADRQAVALSAAGWNAELDRLLESIRDGRVRDYLSRERAAPSD
jgi:CHASE2 domain-containing sensor protein